MPLETAYLFQEVSEQTRSDTAQIATEESYSQGAFLFHAGDPADYLYLLQKGWVRLSVARRGLLSHIVSEPGEAIGVFPPNPMTNFGRYLRNSFASATRASKVSNSRRLGNSSVTR